MDRAPLNVWTAIWSQRQQYQLQFQQQQHSILPQRPLQQAPIARRKPPRANRSVKLYCTFCKKNGEDSAYYSSHTLRDENNQVQCPVLAKYRCPNCNKVGSHTASYCPLQRQKSEAASRVQATPTAPKRRSSRRSSSFSGSSATQSPESSKSPTVGHGRLQSADDSWANHQRQLEIQELAWTIQAFITEELLLVPGLESFSLSQ